jgi:hypothetical protein
VSRSGYCDDLENWDMIRWRGAVASAIRGARGQQLLRELAEGMDAMPVKRLIAHELVKEGEFCALGVVGAKRGLPIDQIDPDESDAVAKAFDIADALAKEIVYENDEGDYSETPEQRWTRMRKWVDAQLIPPLPQRERKEQS